MTFKRCLFLLICLCGIIGFLPCVVFAENGYINCELIDGKDYFTVSGTFAKSDNCTSNVLVLKNGYSMMDFYSMTDEEKAYCIEYIESFYSKTNKFELQIPLPSASGTYNVYITNEGEELKTCFNYYVDGDSVTTTRTTPWMVNYHLTTREQMENGHKGGEAGQMVWALAVSPFDENLVIAGTDTSGIYRSINGGATWIQSSSGLDVPGTVGVAFDPVNKNVVYCLGSPHVTNENTELSESGIYVSYDMGITWTLKYSTPFYRIVSDLIAFDAEGVLVATPTEGVLKSTDFGKTWFEVGNLSTSETDYPRTIIVVNNNPVVTKNISGIFAWNGENWVEKNNGIDVSEMCFGIAVNPKDNTNWYATTLKKIYKSTDSGSSWNVIQNVSNNTFGRGSDKKFTRLFFGVNSDDEVVMYLELSMVSGNIRISKDLGQTFTKPTINKTNAFIRDNNGYGAEPFVISSSNNDILYVSLDGEIYKSTDAGNTYNSACSGLSGMRTTNFWFNKNDPYDMYFCTIDRGAIRTDPKNYVGEYPIVDYSPMEDGTGIRSDSLEKTSYGVCVKPNDRNTVYAYIGGWNSGHIKYSSDGGKTYTSTGITDCTATEMDYVTNSIIYAGNYISYNGGATWEKQDCIVSGWSENNPNIAYGVKKISDLEYHLTRTEDYGVSWKECKTLNINGYQRFTVDFDDYNVIYVGGFTNGYFKYVWDITYNTVTRQQYGADNVFSHIAEEFGMDYMPIYKVAQNPKNHNHLVCGGVNNVDYKPMPGIFESFDKGNTWRLVPGLTGSADVWNIEFHPYLPKVFIGTSSGTFVYEYEKFKPGKIIVTEMPDGVKIWNSDNKMSEAVAIFKEEGEQLKTEESIIKIAPYKNYGIWLDKPCKIFIWDDIKNIQPLSEVYDFVN